MVDTFKGLFIVIKVNKNSTVKIKTKYAKHDQLVNQNLLVKYKQQQLQQTKGSETEQKSKTTPESETEQKKDVVLIRTYNKRICEGREDGGPVTRSKKLPEVHE